MFRACVLRQHELLTPRSSPSSLTAIAIRSPAPYFALLWTRTQDNSNTRRRTRTHVVCWGITHITCLTMRRTRAYTHRAHMMLKQTPARCHAMQRRARACHTRTMDKVAFCTPPPSPPRSCPRVIDRLTIASTLETRAYASNHMYGVYLRNSMEQHSQHNTQ